MSNIYDKYVEQPYVNPYVAFPIEQYANAAQTIQGRFDKNIAAKDQIDIFLKQMPLAPLDKQQLPGVEEAIRKDLDEIYKSGRWQDATYLIKDSVKNNVLGNQWLIAAQNNTAKYAEQQDLQKKLQASGQMLDFTPVDWNNFQTKQNPDGTYTQYNYDIEQDLDKTKKMDELLHGFHESGYSNKVKTIQVRDPQTGGMTTMTYADSQEGIGHGTINSFVDKGGLQMYLDSPEGRQHMKQLLSPKYGGLGQLTDAQGKPIGEQVARERIREEMKNLGGKQVWNKSSQQMLEDPTKAGSSGSGNGPIPGMSLPERGTTMNTGIFTDAKDLFSKYYTAAANGNHSDVRKYQTVFNNTIVDFANKNPQYAENMLTMPIFNPKKGDEGIINGIKNATQIMLNNPSNYEAARSVFQKDIEGQKLTSDQQVRVNSYLANMGTWSLKPLNHLAFDNYTKEMKNGMSITTDVLKPLMGTKEGQAIYNRADDYFKNNIDPTNYAYSDGKTHILANSSFVGVDKGDSHLDVPPSIVMKEHITKDGNQSEVTYRMIPLKGTVNGSDATMEGLANILGDRAIATNYQEAGVQKDPYYDKSGNYEVKYNNGTYYLEHTNQNTARQGRPATYADIIKQLPQSEIPGFVQYAKQNGVDVNNLDKVAFTVPSYNTLTKGVLDKLQ